MQKTLDFKFYAGQKSFVFSIHVITGKKCIERNVTELGCAVKLVGI